MPRIKGIINGEDRWLNSNGYWTNSNQAADFRQYEAEGWIHIILVRNLNLDRDERVEPIIVKDR